MQMVLPFTRQDRVRVVVRGCPLGKIWDECLEKEGRAGAMVPLQVLAEDNHVLIAFSTREADVQEVKGVVRTHGKHLGLRDKFGSK